MRKTIIATLIGYSTSIGLAVLGCLLCKVHEPGVMYLGIGSGWLGCTIYFGLINRSEKKKEVKGE